ncbi:MAG: hypothetical protein RL685_202 [Pseudomonadota bacterium]|jgi:endonuclease/exonuclease/phosphatase (EEP) superfamily protein YafD
MPQSLSLPRITVIPALVALVVACGKPPLQRTQPTPGAPHFTVMTYNVELHSAGEPTTLAAIGTQNADVVALQEMTHDTEALVRERYADQYPYQLFQSAGGTDGLAFLSRYELTDQGIQPGPGGWHPAWHVNVALPGVSLQVLNVHLRSLFSGGSGVLQSYLSTDEDHVLEIDDLASRCDDALSNLVVGDFNEGPAGDAIAFLERNGFDNVLPAFHPGQPTWRFRSVAGQLESTVDHILYDDTLRPLDSWVDVKGRSDHLPVLAHFEPVTWVSSSAAE